jgi:glutamate N-acetyltransferase/amino-acid N-acetyltransferase
LNKRVKTTTHQGITAPLGFSAAGLACGIKHSGQPDLTLIVADRTCAVAGVFTTNQLPSPSVMICRQHVHAGKARAIICNSGISNASTGSQGRKNAIATCQKVAQQLGWPSTQYRHVLPCSTGIIGHQLPMKKLTRGIQTLAPRLSIGPQADAEAATAIMTTDLVPKQAYRTLRIGEKTVQLAGICKGSGMIAPNMATMLAFITTDLSITAQALRKALKQATNAGFNRISVDQHTSPSDTVLALASGAAQNPTIRTTGKNFNLFQAALTDLCQDLAYQIVKDGEGATRVFRIRITNARNLQDADRAAKAIVNSPLVKTAVHGADPNWGRITTAAGYSGATINPEKTSLFIGHRKNVCVFRRGQPTHLTRRDETALKKIMNAAEVAFTLDLGLGRANTEWLGCDLSHQYVTINADYTT